MLINILRDEQLVGLGIDEGDAAFQPMKAAKHPNHVYLPS